MADVMKLSDSPATPCVPPSLAPIDGLRRRLSPHQPAGNKLLLSRLRCDSGSVLASLVVLRQSEHNFRTLKAASA
jgi:hypothetical protein